MRTRTKVWLIIAVSLIFIGCILFTGIMKTLKWDFMKLSTVNYETNTYEIGEDFNSISINTDTADIEFVSSDDGKCTVVCHEQENAKHSVTVEEDTLTIELIEERSVYDFVGYIGLNFDTPQITVYLPKTQYDSLFIKESTGDIGVENITVDLLDLTVSTGDINLTDIECKNLISKGNTGDIFLKNVVATEKFYIERSTGDVRFDGSDAAEVFVTTDTGNVTGSLLTDKEFIAQTDTGRVEVPKTVNGGKCEIKTDTGDIKIIKN